MLVPRLRHELNKIPDTSRSYLGKYSLQTMMFKITNYCCKK